MRSPFLLLLLSLTVCVKAQDVESPPAPDFAREVRPLLSDRCFGCHGPAEQHADLRLDSFEGATDWVVTPGDADASELITRVTLEEDDELRMPPIHSDKDRLTEAEIDLLRRWIESGAEYQDHWAFAPLERPAPPEMAEAPSPIDAFVTKRLQAEGLWPGEEADRRTLARRVCLDLTGLPPTPEQVAEFLADRGAGAYERYVDRLLASPRYGEQMARHWLDVVRYGDTHGKHLDNYREIWPYRDWVIHALNDNKPYDQFLIEQLAGDLLPNPTDDQLIATGFVRCNLSTAEGGTIEKEIYTDNVRDRTDAFGTVVLGLTVACAKCHDHKYDPITQEDYYSLFAFFNSIDGGPNDRNSKDHAPALAVPTPEYLEMVEQRKREAEALREQLESPNEAFDTAQRRWEQTLVNLADPAIGGTILPGAIVRAGEWRYAGPFPGEREEIQKGKAPPELGPFDAEQTWELADGKTVAWSLRPDLIDGKPLTGLPGKASAHLFHRTLTVTEATELDLSLGSDDTLRVYLNGEVVHEHPQARGLTPGSDKVKLSLKAGENEILIRVGNLGGASGLFFEILDATVLPEEMIAAATTPASERSETQRRSLQRVFRERSGLPELVALRKQVADAAAAAAKAEREAPTTLIFRERAEPRDAFILVRGEYDSEGDKVERATPGFLPPMDESLSRDRLGLAKWAVSPENPLAARVAVNRFWQQLFGVGLVKTADDFGSQAQPPSHPELLDWLAADFVASGWDVKRLMKQLVMSGAYRRSSAAPNGIWKSDPENRLLARGPRFRLDGEQLRDQALALSGLLVNRLGGPPVRPPQPSGLWKAVAYEASNTAKFVADEAPEKVHRRSLYTFHKRTSPPPQMAVMDGPSRESCAVRRERTNTPLQALMLMNDPQYVEAARALAERVLRDVTDSPDARAAYLIELATARPATEVEVSELVAAVAEEHELYANAQEAATRLIAVGAAPPDERFEPAEVAAWTMAANLVLNLDEVLSKN